MPRTADRFKSQLGGLGAALLLLLLAGIAPAQSPPAGAALFEKRCYSCHNIGSGNKKGPDLKGVTERRAKEWLHEFIQTPAAVNRRGDPAAVELFKKFAPEEMPDQSLTPEEMDAILALIQDLTKKGEVFIPAGAKLSRPIVPSDVDAGLRLFTGRVALKGGGAACLSCHNLNGVGRLGGGTLGPDLTAANIKYRDPELISILQHPNFPTMTSVFATRPLTDEELVQLFALFQNAKQRNPTAPVGATTTDFKFPLLGAVALILALAGLNFVWKNRLRGVREALVRGSQL
jgi:mono/diheme cytochrome c family protein